MGLLNLLVNARDAMPDGGSVVIEARMENVTERSGRSLKSGRYVCLSVTDTGEGMDEATLARATEPFFTTKAVGKGTGLGLPAVQAVAEQAGGQFVLQSRKGEGTTAELWLPEAAVDAEHPGRPADAQRIGASVRPLAVLVVDDDELVRMNTSAMLEDLGHTVFNANSGLRALDILREEKTIGLVIVDYAMPHMTGIQLAEVVRAEWPNLPIILMTGYGNSFPGADAGVLTLAKPFRHKDLIQAVSDAIQADPSSR